MSNKNTRLIYTDETNLAVYRSLPDKDFKEFMMAYLTYKKGMDITKMFSNPLVESIFRLYVSKIEYNEDKWEKQAQARRENGKKGGRPKKNVDITANEDFDNEVSDKSTPVQEKGISKEEQFNKEVESNINRQEQEQPQFEVEDYIESNINKVLVPYIQHQGEQYYNQLSMLSKDVNRIYPDVSIFEAQSIIEDEVKRRSKKVG